MSVDTVSYFFNVLEMHGKRVLLLIIIIPIVLLVWINLTKWNLHALKGKTRKENNEATSERTEVQTQALPTRVVYQASTLPEDPKSFLHVVTNFPVSFPGNDSQTPKGKQRLEEFVVCLKRNLAHPLVKRIHLLLENQMEKDIILQRKFPKEWKLVLSITGKSMTHSDVLKYISKNLLHETAVMTNADCYLADGWEKLNVSILKQKTIYILTRHESEYGKKHCGFVPKCDGPTYIGSHDTYVYHLTEPMHEMVIKKLDYPPSMYGIEQNLITNLRLYTKFTLKNPCKILHVIHYHCSHYVIESAKTINGKRLDETIGLPPGHNVIPFSDL